MMILLVLASRLSVSSTRTKSVGQLGYRKDAFGVELLSFLLRHARQQAELILLYTLTAAPSLELALAAMSVQHKVWRRIGDQECGDLFDPFSYLTDEGRCLHLQRGMVVAMHDLAQVYLASKRFGQQERIERQQELVFLCKFVGEFETIGDELGR